MTERESNVWKVVHKKDNVETVYLVHAFSQRDAVTQVLDTLYERNFFRKEDPKRLADDQFGLLAAGQYGSWTNKKLMRDHSCSISASLFQPDPPYKLYTLDLATGVMT